MRRLLLALLPATLLACAETDKSDEDDEEGIDTGLATGGGGEDGGGEDGGDDGGSGEDGGDDGGSGEDGGGEDGDGDDDGGGTGGDEGGDEGPPPLLPAEGGWTPSGFTVTSDACGLTNFEDPSSFIPSSFEISDVSEAGFSIGEPGQPATACSYSEPDFTCAVSSTEQEVGLGLDATLLLDNTFSGTVLAEDDIDGRIDLSVTCDGGSCGLLELAGLAFPCALEGTFDMAW
jgi:hypothetical protein